MGHLTDQPAATDPYEGRDGLVLGMHEDEYHGGPEFSSSAAKEILRSPAHYKHVYLDGNKKSSKAFDVGTAAHAKVLGIGAQAVAYPTKVLAANGAASTAEAKKWATEQRAAGLIPVKQSELDEVNAMAESVLSHPDIYPALEQDGWPEASVFARDPDTGLELRCRFDFLPSSHPMALDLKTTTDASLKGFTRAIEDLMYDVQHGHYTDVAAYAGLGIEDMIFVAVESKAPFLANPIRLEPEWIEMGKVRARAARTRLLQCRERGEWPGYPPGVKRASPPPWAINRFQDEMSEEMEGLL